MNYRILEMLSDDLYNKLKVDLYEKQTGVKVKYNQSKSTQIS